MGPGAVPTHPGIFPQVHDDTPRSPRSKLGKDLMDIHTNHNSKKITILNQFLDLNIAIAIT